MKKTIHYLTVLALFLVANSLFAQNFSTSPEKPIGGETITIHYRPAGGPLATIPFDAVAYLYENGQENPTAIDIDLKKEADGFVGQLPLTAKSQFVLFSFGNDELEKTDDNGGKGYTASVYKTDRTAPAVGALGIEALTYYGFGKMANIKPDLDKALNLAKQEIASNPAAWNNMRFASSYAMLGMKLKNQAVIEECKAQIAKANNNKKASEDELRNAFSMATALEEKELADALNKRADEQYPNGLAAKKQATNALKNAENLDERVKIYNEAKAKFGKEKDMAGTFNSFAGAIANEYAGKEDWANFEKYFSQITDRTRAAGILNNIAWPMSGESLETEAKNPAKGAELSKRSLELLDKELADLASKPSNISAKKWRNNLEYSKAMYADTYALLLFKNGKIADALKYQTMACEKNDFSDGEMTERYSVFYEKTHTPQETEQLLADLIGKGKANTKMLAQHKRLFLANNSVESAYEKYVTSLEKEAKAKKRKEIEEKMLDEAAPGFTLRNLKGEQVSLESLRGKVVVLDFWATWCGPCKASFPGMQQAVNQFANRSDVAFLFVDTWENAADKAKAAGDFIASKSYTFNVLMDEDNSVVTNYGVSGIPTKFVVDRDGKIRFKAVGFGGNDAELVEELTTMIEIAGGNTNP